MSVDQVLVWMDRNWNQWAISLRKYYAQRIETEGFSFGEVVTDENLNDCTTNVKVVYEALRHSAAQPQCRIHKAELQKLKSETLIVELSPGCGFIAAFGKDNSLVGATMPCAMNESLQWIFNKVPIDTPSFITEVPFLRIHAFANLDLIGMDEYIMAKVYEQTFSYNKVGGVGNNFSTDIFTGWSFWWRNQQFRFKYEGGGIRNYSKSYRQFSTEPDCTCFTNMDGSSYTSEWHRPALGESNSPKIGRGNILPFKGIRVEEPGKRLWQVKFSILYAPREIPYSGTVHNILTFDLDKYEMTAFTTDDGFE
ncbi:MAG: hypothetical protein ACK5QS_13370 [Pseudanabaenaceae cyanobacterium]